MRDLASRRDTNPENFEVDRPAVAGPPQPVRLPRMPTSPSNDLPRHLAERTRPLNERIPRADAEFVLLWLHHAVRVDENPALDVAAHLAASVDRPLIIYQGLGGRHRFNSDRHHTFILEGARDFDRAIHERGWGAAVRFVFHLPRDPSAPSPLRSLVARAAAFVTEEFPAPPFPQWTHALAARATGAAIAVDATCVVPMQSTRKAPERAFVFRDRASSDYFERIRAPWAECPASPAGDAHAVDLHFEPADVQAIEIADACAECRIDHSIGPVDDTPGGTLAGTKRWESFRDGTLRRYHRLRNDAARPDGVSRISAYLHHGHLSPFRVGREAHRVGGDGAEKFIDELFVWRELAHHFCFHRTQSDVDGRTLETLDALPSWARESLDAHRGDERPMRYTWEMLAGADTGSDLWNAAQTSLVRHGELHNNLRMTWGKAIVSWTETPEAALETLIDLNHRFALDGNDPNSYGGLLWCLGVFDRPFSPGQPILGSIRGRDCEVHAERLDVSRFRDWAERPGRGGRRRILIVGSGVAGLTAARTLERAGHVVNVIPFGASPTDDDMLTGGRIDDPRLVQLRRSWEMAGILRPASDATDRIARIRAHLASSDSLIRDDLTFVRAHADRSDEVRIEMADADRTVSRTFEGLVVATDPDAAAELLEPVAGDLASAIRTRTAAETPLGRDALSIRSAPLVACGAWACTSVDPAATHHVEASILSGIAAAGLLGSRSRPVPPPIPGSLFGE